MGKHPPQPTPLVSLQAVTKRFPGVVANAAVSLEIMAGEVHVLLGENGAGKSTLISLLAGMAQPEEGRILMDGKPVPLESPRHALRLGIGTVYQHSTLVPGLTVLENLMLGAPWWQRQDREGQRERFLSIAEKLGIELPEKSVLGELSLGQQQLVEVIKALWRGQRLLILDEATAMLTPKGVDELKAVVRRLAQSGVAVLLVTHKLPEALAFGDRISVLRQGRLVGTLSAAQLRLQGEQEALDRLVEMMFGPVQDGPVIRRRTRGGSHGAGTLEVEDLCVSAEQREAWVRDATFAVHAGEILGIAGVDGNGQKQLAQALAGQRPILSGRIRLAREPIEQATVSQRQSRGLRYVTDDRLGEGTVGSLPISFNLLLKRIGDAPFWNCGIERPKQIYEHAERLVRRYLIRAPGPATPLSHLSGGNVQKVVLARELDGQPKAIIYNKPSYGLDFHNSQAARAAIRSQADEGVATLLISTDLDELLDLSDRIGVMRGGRLVGIVENDAEARRRVAEMMVSGAAA